MERMRVLRWSVRAGLALLLTVAVMATMLPQQTLAAPAERVTASYVYHTVRPGDTLSRIAQSYGVSMSSIMSANGIYNPDHIYVGQRLKIPSGHVGCAFHHTVTRGQTLSGIAVYYGVGLYSLAEANGISHTSFVYVGQVLCVPSGGGTGGPSPSPEGFYYTVRPGDTLSSIAWRYGTSVAAIMRQRHRTS
ncbi:MAG: LysM peptidoglycan-binding domain-containing protein [Caldilineaceae bacterium]